MAEKKATEYKTTERVETDHAAIRNTIYTTDKEAQYDKEAKEIMGNKYILAWLLVNVVEEFYDMDPREAAAYIEGDPYVGIVPVEPGMTNGAKEKNGEKIIGLNAENSEKNEGVIYFDILFFARTRNGKSKIIIDVEIQKDEPTAYRIMNRAVFYVSRQISSQKEREFTNSHYNDIKQVYSVWICLNEKKDSLQHIQFEKKEQKGNKTWKGEMGIPNIVMLGLSQELPEPKEENILHRLLGTLFSDKLSVNEKMAILENEYHIPMEQKLKGGLNIMCNLSQGIKEKGRSEGRIEGRIEGERIGEARGEQRGIVIGEARGEQRGRRYGENIMIQLFNRLMSTDRMEDWLRVTKDEAYRRQLIKEMNIQ